MSKLILYSFPFSQPGRAVQLFLRANSIPHKDVFVDLIKGDQLTEEFAKNVNPLKRVPVIHHDGFRVFESVAILRYLARTFTVPDHWYPKDSHAQARVDEYLEYQHLSVRLPATMFFWEKHVAPREYQRPVNEENAANYLKNYINVLGIIESFWLKDRPFITGHKISIADLLAVAEMEQPATVGYDTKKHHPKIREYIERVRAILQPHYDEVHSAVYELARQANKKN